MIVVDRLKYSRILVVTAAPEDVRVFLMDQLTDLRKRGCEIHVATGYGCDLPELQDFGIVQHRLPLTRQVTPSKDLKALWEIFRLCRQWHFDLIHTHTVKASLIGQIGARLAGVPVRVETVHGTVYMPDRPFVMRKTILWCERLAAWQAQRVWVLNTDDFHFFKSQYIAKSEALQLLGEGGIGTNLQRFRPGLFTSEQRRQYRRDLMLPEDALVVGFVGRLVKDKGINELIEAWPKIQEQIPNAYLLVVAACLVSERRYEMVDPSRLEKMPNTILLRNRHDMAQLYNCMDVLVLPSYREGFPCVIMEASACGVPVVASDVRGCREAVLHGQTGLLVPPYDWQKISSAIQYLLKNDSRCHDMAQQARKYAEEHFDQRIAHEHIRNTYESLLEKYGPKD